MSADFRLTGTKRDASAVAQSDQSNKQARTDTKSSPSSIGTNGREFQVQEGSNGAFSAFNRALPVLVKPKYPLPTTAIETTHMLPLGETVRLYSNPNWIAVASKNADFEAGVKYFMEKKFAEAILCYEKVQEGDALFGFAQSDIGSCYFMQKDYKNANVFYENALKFLKAGDQRDIIRSNLGECCCQLEQYAKAIEHFNQVVYVEELWKTVQDKINQCERSLELITRKNKLGQIIS